MSSATQTKSKKSKGSKIVSLPVAASPLPASVADTFIPSVILHLKCTLKDLVDQTLGSDAAPTPFVSQHPHQTTFHSDPVVSLESLGANLHKDVAGHIAYCFWCCHSFDGDPVGIPVHKLDSEYELEGCYCSPSCAAADLLTGQVRCSSSAKYDRYQLLHHLYSPDAKICVAPSPRYLLNNFCGSITIEQFRQLSSGNRRVFFTNKPVRRICPELHEDNAEFILHGQSIRSASKAKRTTKKDTYIQEQFNRQK